MFSHSSNSREAINETANSGANSADDFDANKSADAPPDDCDGGGGDDDEDDDDDDAAAVDEQASWFGMGRLGSAALSLAQGVASAIHQTAVNAAKELAEMERLAGQEAKEEKKARQHERNENDLCTTTKDSGRSSTGTSALSLPLPWQVPSTENGRGTQQESSNDDDNSLPHVVPLVEDEVLKEKILALARTKSAFEGPFTVENTNATTTTFPANDNDQESPTYFTKDRVELIERLFSIDKNLAKAHALVTFGATEEKAEELFFRNYFHHTEEERANHTIRDKELDIDIVLQTPPSSPDQHNRPLISALPAPRQLSIDDLVIIG